MPATHPTATPKGYLLTLPAELTISIRGLSLMLRDFAESKGVPKGFLMTQKCFNHLCREARLSGKRFTDRVASDTPLFEGVAIYFTDLSSMDSTALLDSFDAAEREDD